MKFFQRLGKSIMLPVAVLPVAAILAGIGNALAPLESMSIVSVFLLAAGTSLLDNLALLFAVGISFGMAKKGDGTAALAGLVSWLVVTTLLSPTSVAGLMGLADESEVDIGFTRINNVFIGILCGLIGAWCYDRFKDTKLPDALSFFAGRRSVAIVTAGLSLVVAVVLFFVWPIVFGALVAFGEWMLTLGPFGAGLYGFFNRLLIPLGLHHALNAVFWFDVAGINDLTNFLSGEGERGVTGQYMTGFFPIMMFGLPGAALAMVLTAKTAKRKLTYGIMLSAAVASFLVGVTEPLEFSFMFLAPGLYVMHAAFTGISLFVTTLLPVRSGFGFSAGFIDLMLSWFNPLAVNPWIIFILGPIWFVIYFVAFYFTIKIFRLKTPGREDDDEVTAESGDQASGGDKYHVVASRFLDSLGGAANITDLDNCATRLRMEVADPAVIDEAGLRSAGAAGVMKPGGKSVQVVYGLNVQFVKDAMERIMSGEVSPAAAPVATDGRAEAPAGAAPVATVAPAIVTLRQPLEGDVVALGTVPDETFAGEVMGPGLAIQPTGNTVVAPAAGTVGAVFPTSHAVALTLEDGTELLIHVGIDTVEMNGDGFETLVSVGDEVAEGVPLLRFDLEKIRAAGHPTITPVVVLNNESATVRFR